jgi:hypothetical protein
MATKSHGRALIVALILGLLMGSCKSPVRVDSQRLFAGFDYAGSYAGDPSSIPADLQRDSPPAVPTAEINYVYRPRETGRFHELGMSTFVDRLKQQGFQIQSAPGINGGNFTPVDPTTILFVIDFYKRDCAGSLTGKQRTDGSEEYVLKLRDGC